MVVELWAKIRQPIIAFWIDSSIYVPPAFHFTFGPDFGGRTVEVAVVERPVLSVWRSLHVQALSLPGYDGRLVTNHAEGCGWVAQRIARPQ
jgi:hypothetical protein